MTSLVFFLIRSMKDVFIMFTHVHKQMTSEKKILYIIPDEEHSHVMFGPFKTLHWKKA